MAEKKKTTVKEEPKNAPVKKDKKSFRLVKVEIDNLNIRTGPGKNHNVTGKFTGKGTFKITEEIAGEGSESGWGKLASGEGWISLDFVTKE